MKRSKFVSGKKGPRPKCVSCDNPAEPEMDHCIHCAVNSIKHTKNAEASMPTKMTIDFRTYNDYSNWVKNK